MKQISPVCRVAGTFTVRGHAGLNKVVFEGRLRGRQLAPGTYRISARTRGGATVLRVTVVIVESGIPSPTELEGAKRSDVCGLRAALAASRLTGATVAPEGQGPTRHRGQTKSASPDRGAVASASSTHGNPFSPQNVSKNVRNPLVIAALARYRGELATAGATALAAAIVALLLA